MNVIHLSDLHLSRYGESGTWTERDSEDGERWQLLQGWQRWEIEGCRDRKGRPDKLRLVDPDGLVHKVKSWPSKEDEKIITSLLEIAKKRYLTSAERLIRSRPSPEEVEAMLVIDRRNTNLRFLQVVDQVSKLEPAAIFVTGDITDNGFGYDLLVHYLAPWIERRQLFAVPGNHDIYDMLPRLGRRVRIQSNIERFKQFAAAIGLEPGPSGAYLRRLGDVAVVGLNSCKLPLTPLSASGAVSKEQLSWLRGLVHDSAFKGARLRIGLVHHHLLGMPFLVGKRTPIEMGMKLRNAVETMEVCTEAGMDILLNGHRHHGYIVKLPGMPMVVSSPSSTLGCKSTGTVYCWTIDLDAPQPFPLMHRLISSEVGDSD
jgi:3',5'-cyclic AMP phosphodiesterase CpdA